MWKNIDLEGNIFSSERKEAQLVKDWLSALPSYVFMSWKSQGWNLDTHTFTGRFSFSWQHTPQLEVRSFSQSTFQLTFLRQKEGLKQSNNQEVHQFSFVAVTHGCKLGGLKNTELVFCSSVGQKSGTGLNDYRVEVSGRLPSFLEAVGENPFPCLFHLLGAVCIPRLMATFLLHHQQMLNESSCSHLSSSLRPEKSLYL